PGRPERVPPRLLADAPRSELRELVAVSPLRARSLLTVRAAISSARAVERPCRFSDFLISSYWRSRLLPFFTPRGGTVSSLRSGSEEDLPGAAALEKPVAPRV